MLPLQVMQIIPLSGTDANGDVSGNDPDLTFNVGDQITFSVNASGHPFYLKTVAGSGSGNQISGVTNQGTENGSVVWTPTDAGTFYYQCGPHTAMFGTITINSTEVSESTFTNAGGDNLWSNAANWSAGIPTVDTAKIIVDTDLIVDSNKTVAQIKTNNTSSAASVTITATNSSVLTITGAGVGQPIQNNKNAGSFIFNLPVVFDSSEDATETLRFNNGGDQSISFLSSLTLNDPLTVSGTNKNHDLNLNGSLLGSGNLIFGAKAQTNFGTAYDGSSYNGTLTTAGGGGTTNNQVTIISNVADDGTFLKSGGSLNITKDGAKITVNGANTLKGNITVSDYNPSLNVNKNQSAVGTITMGSGTLTLTVAASLTELAFADNSSSDWGTGSLVITGAGNNEVSFGTDASGLTETQLALITLNGSTPFINDSGQLYNSSISESTFNNAGGDNLWSNAANWSAGIPNVDAAKIIIDADLIVDSNKTVAQIKNNSSTSAASVTITATNDATLTITGVGVTQPIQNNKKSSSFIFDLPVVFDSDGETETLRLNSGGDETSGFANITFSSSLTLNDPLTVSGVNKNHDLNLNGSLLGSANLIFASTRHRLTLELLMMDRHMQELLLLQVEEEASNNQVTIISNVADDGTFLKSGGSLNITKDGAKITVNGVNTLKGNIAVADYNPSLTVNKNQSAVGTITMGSGTLTLTVPESLTELAFADNSSSDWGTGSLVITGAGNNEISFGTDASGLTEAQLALISLNGSTPVINTSGQLSTSSVLISTFNNAGGDNLWSNAANWSAGIPTDNTAKITVDADLTVDSDKTVAQIKMAGTGSAASVTITATNDATLTITGVGVTQPIQNNKKSSSFIFDLPVVFDSDGETETLRLNSGGDETSGFANITFSSSLTLYDPLTVSGVNKNHDLNLNGSLLGSANLIFATKTQANFGTAYDGSSYEGTLTVAGGGEATNNQVTIISNVADDGTFLRSESLLNVINEGVSITVNGANTLKGNISLGDNDPVLTINTNQSTVGTVTMGAGTLTLIVPESLTELAFADNSSSDWGTGSLVITGAGNNEISFGTDASGLTEAQLALISLNGSTPVINSSGQLSIPSLFNLPSNNNKVSVTSSTCIGNTDGSIGLSIEDASYNYTVTVTGQDDPITLGGETKTASVTGLGKGTYTVCFKVDGQDAYEQCFEVNIEEPKALSAFIDVNNDTRKTSIQLSGSSTYTVDINGESYDVKGDRFNTTLPSGLEYYYHKHRLRLSRHNRERSIYL
jgi:hypothetical protein